MDVSLVTEMHTYIHSIKQCNSFYFSKYAFCHVSPTVYKKFELMLTRRAKAYISFYLQTVSRGYL